MKKECFPDLVGSGGLQKKLTRSRAFGRAKNWVKDEFKDAIKDFRLASRKHRIAQEREAGLSSVCAEPPWPNINSGWRCRWVVKGAL